MTPAWSLIVPLYNEAAGLPELLTRLVAVAEQLSGGAELVLVNDASTDATGALLQAAASDVVRPLQLPHNRGQLGATLAGLEAGRGQWLAVLDGDLQDPPELLLQLADRLYKGDVEVVFATKRDRSDPLLVRLGAGILRGVERHLLGLHLPAGAGAFCAMTRPVGDALLQRRQHWPRSANLATLLGVLQVRSAAVTYHKAQRRHGDSKLGLAGLVREALGSLQVAAAARLAKDRSRAG